MRTLLSILLLTILNPSQSEAQTWRTERWKTRWTVPRLTDANYRKWLRYIRPSAREAAWRKIDWRPRLMPAVKLARRLRRPVLLWVMNGNPLGDV